MTHIGDDGISGTEFIQVHELEDAEFEDAEFEAFQVFFLIEVIKTRCA